MKKSAKVTLTVVATVGLASCGRGRLDPCQPEYFSEFACQEAVHSGGYYWRGTWYPMIYHYAYPYYYDSYTTFVRRGGHVVVAPSGSYTQPGKTFGTGGSGASSSSSGTVRGGFGSTGSGGSSGA